MMSQEKNRLVLKTQALLDWLEISFKLNCSLSIFIGVTQLFAGGC